MFTVHSRRVVPGLHVVSGCVIFPDYFEDVPEVPDWYDADEPVHSPFNAYLLTGERPLLYDTLPPNMVEEALTEVATILDGRDLEYVVVSHPEAPHGGNASALLEAYPGAELLLPSAGSMHDLHVGADPSSFRTVGHREVVDLGDGAVEFHDPLLFDLAATVWMYERRTGTLFTSDAYGYPHHGGECGLAGEDYVDGPGSMASRWRNFHTTAIPWIRYFDPAKYDVLVENLLSKYDVDVLAPAHGEPILEDAADYPPVLSETMADVRETGGGKPGWFF